MQDCSQPAPGVFVGVDVAKGKHYACALSARGEPLFARPVPNDEGAIRRLIDDAAAHGSAALVVDRTSSAAVLALGVAAECEIPVAYVTGLAMRRAAGLYAGAAKTDPKDAQVLADYAWATLTGSRGPLSPTSSWPVCGYSTVGTLTWLGTRPGPRTACVTPS